MENLPNEINYVISEYVYGCRKHNQIIFNKESKQNFLKITNKCKKIKLLGKCICQECDKKTIWYLKTMMDFSLVN